MKRLYKLYYGPKGTRIWYDNDGQEYETDDSGAECIMVDEITGDSYHCNEDGSEYNPSPGPEPKVVSTKLILHADKETYKVDIGTIDTYNDGYIKLNTGPHTFDKKELISLLLNG